MKTFSPLKAIRKNCLECAGDSSNEVKLCEIDYCPLWAYRFGHNPKKKGQGPSHPTFIKKTQAQQPILAEKGHVQGLQE